MAKYRQIHVKIWKDEWFLDLQPTHKLFYIYLFSNERASLAGIYELPKRVMSFESGLSMGEIDEAFTVYSNAKKAWYDDGVVLIPNLRKYHETKSPKVLTAIMSDFNEIKECELKDMYRELYGIDRVSDRVSIHSNRSSSSSSSNNSGEEKNDRESLKAAILTATKINPLVVEPQDEKRIDKLFQAGYTAEQVEKVYSPGGYWFKEDWRGQRGQRPTVKDIMTTIGAGLEWQPSANGSALSKQDKAQMLVSLVKKYGRPRAREAIPELEQAGLLDAAKQIGWTNLCGMQEKDIPFAYYRVNQ